MDRSQLVKSQLIEQLAQKLDLTAKVADLAVETFFATLTDGLARGKRVEIRGFGSFSRREYPSYVGRNPKTGESVNVPPKVLPFYRMGKELKNAVNAK